MTKPDLMAELAEVVRLLETKAMLSREGEGAAADFYLIQYEQASAAFIYAHHAELEAVVRDAARYRWLRESEAMLWKDGDSHPVDFDLDTAIDAQMHNSAREG